MDGAPAEVIEDHHVHIALPSAIIPVTTTNENTVKPFAYLLVVPFDQTVHDLVFRMKEESLINLNVCIRCHAEIMAVFIAMYPIEIAGQVIDAADTDLPWIKNAVSHLRGQGHMEIIACHTEAYVATIDKLTFQIRHIRKELCRSLTHTA